MNPFQLAMKRRISMLLVPIVYRLAARLEQVEIEEMIEDPATAAYVLRNVQRLFGLPAIFNHYRLGVELENAGCTVERDSLGVPISFEGVVDVGRSTLERLEGLVDTVARLSFEMQGRAAVIGVATGPGTLAALSGASAPQIAELYVALASKYKDAGAEALILAEAPGIATERGLLLETTKELSNVCRFFRLGSVLLAPSASGLTGVLDRVCCQSDLLEVDAFEREPDEILKWKSKGVVFTAGEVPENLEPERLSSWLNAFNSGGEGE